MAWLILIVAGAFEVGWAVGLKYTEGFTRLWPSLGTGVALILSFLLLAQAVKTLPVGTAYAVWTGIGVGRNRPARNDPFRRVPRPLAGAQHPAHPGRDGGADAPAKRLKTDVVDCHSGGRGSFSPRRRDGRAAEGGGLENR